MTWNILTALSFTFLAAAVWAQPPSVNKPLPPLSISDRGELLLQNKEASYRPWNASSNHGKVHILQYFAGTKSASQTFEPFTDMLQQAFPDGGYHVTTVINLDAAMWGTSGFVTSEAKASKLEYPDATMVLDEDGTGEMAWELGKKGAILAVMDKFGSVIYLAREALSEQQLAASLALVKGQIGS